MPQHRAFAALFAQSVFFAHGRNNVLGKPQRIAVLICHAGRPRKRRRLFAFAQLVQRFPAELRARRNQIHRRIFFKSLNQLFDKPRRADRIVPLQIDNQLRLDIKDFHRFAHTVGAGLAGIRRHQAFDSVHLAKVRNPLVLGRNHDSRIGMRRSLARNIDHAQQHFFAGNLGQRFPRKARRTVARRNHNKGLYHQFSSVI